MCASSAAAAAGLCAVFAVVVAGLCASPVAAGSCALAAVSPGYTVTTYAVQGAGQSEAAWYVRSAPRVKQAFAAIWGTTQLLVSFDALCVWRSEGKHRPLTLHCDQNPNRTASLDCVQGLVDLLGTARSRGGNVLVPRSHLVFDNWTREKFRAHLEQFGGDDYFEVPDSAAAELMQPITVHLDPGVRVYMCVYSFWVVCVCVWLTGLFLSLAVSLFITAAPKLPRLSL